MFVFHGFFYHGVLAHRSCKWVCWSRCLASESLLSTIDSCLSVRMFLCPDVCLSQTSNCFFFFVSRWNRAIFWPSVLHDPPYETVFFNFWFRSFNTQNLLPKICTKSPISWLVWQIDRRCLHLPGVFGDGRFNGTTQNVMGPTLVAMATKFGLGVEIQSPTGVFCLLLLGLMMMLMMMMILMLQVSEPVWVRHHSYCCVDWHLRCSSIPTCCKKLFLFVCPTVSLSCSFSLVPCWSEYRQLIFTVG